MKIQFMKKALGVVFIIAVPLCCAKLHPQVSCTIIKVDTLPSKSHFAKSRVEKREIRRIEGKLKQFKLKGYKKWEPHRQGVLIQRKRLEFKKRDFIPLSVYI